jgi:hypothetical protein
VTLTHTECYDFHEVFLKYTTLIKVHLKLQPVLYLSLVFGIYLRIFQRTEIFQHACADKLLNVSENRRDKHELTIQTLLTDLHNMIEYCWD